MDFRRVYIAILFPGRTHAHTCAVLGGYLQPGRTRPFPPPANEDILMCRLSPKTDIYPFKIFNKAIKAML